MKSKITLIILLCLSSILSGQTVNIEGDPYGGNPYATIQDAVAASTNSNDVILITGIHTGTVNISKSLTLRGTDPTADIIQAAASASTDGTGSNVINVVRADDADVLTVTIENLGVRYGNADSNTNGGGINIDKVTNLITLKNLIIENNYTAKNGGGISFAGSNAQIIDCTIRNNSSNLDGAGIILAPNNGAGIDVTIDVKSSLIDSNTGRNGGGIYVNGNNGFGNDYRAFLNIENTTISNNATTSGTSGSGGGGIWCKGAVWTTNAGGDGTSGNIHLKMVHATLYNNSHTSAAKNGIQFTNSAGPTNFSIYNSIVVSADDLTQKALNFANSNTTDVVNSILGGLNAAPAAIVDDVNKNNQKGRTATQSGLTGVLSDEGGATQVIAIGDGTTAVNFCTAATGITLPTVDQRGATRSGNPDAGAFEFDGVLSVNSDSLEGVHVKIYPNPASGIVKITGIDQIERITIYSVLGSVERVINNQSSFDVSELSHGLHLMVIKTKEGQVSKRLLVQ